MSARGGTSIVVDGSLLFRFDDDWLPTRWDEAPERAKRHRGGRKSVDLAAVGARALLVEVKDDRAQTAESRRRRQASVDTGAFLASIATKVNHTVEDLRDAAELRESTFALQFAAAWSKDRRRVVLWWERGPNPPSGPGTPDARWKAHFSAMTNTLKQHLAPHGRRALVTGRPFSTGPDAGVTVEDVPAGVARRRGR